MDHSCESDRTDAQARFMGLVTSEDTPLVVLTALGQEPCKDSGRFVEAVGSLKPPG